MPAVGRLLPRLVAPALLAGSLTAASPALACLPASGHIGRDSIRGVHVGATARVPALAISASYCVETGGDVSFAVDRDARVVLVLTTAASDRVRDFGPGRRARGVDDLRPLGRADDVDLYRLDGDNQVVLGIRSGRVTFIAAVDRLLLASRGKLTYWLGRLRP